MKNSICRLLCRLFGHRYVPFWNYDKPFKDVTNISDKTVAVSFNEYKCDRCGHTISAYN